MSLHDRIMELPSELEWDELRERAAKLDKEADDLIDWTRARLETLRQLADSAASFDEAKIAIKRIDDWKEASK